MESQKLFHFHLEDGMKNTKTLIGRLVNGCIRYTFYGGTGSSGTPFSLSNIQFYERVNGNIRWLRNASLPVDNEEGETIEQFKERVKDMLNNSTLKVIKEVNTNVTFK
jgi:hypothetical protein